MNKSELLEELNKYKKLNLSLDMSRGKPSKEQLGISLKILDEINSNYDFSKEDIDPRNYGELTGLEAAKELMSIILEVPANNIIVGGNSSLNLMYDQISRSYNFGVCGSKPWKDYPKIKWLCVTPGYDRHFAITEQFGFELISIPLLEDGPDMDLVETLVKDETVKGIWCVPKFSNPTGVTYSDEVIKRLAKLQPTAKDFRIYYDNAYTMHYFQKDVPLLNIYEEAKKYHNEDIVYIFGSTNKITFPGSGISAIGASERNINDIKDKLKYQIISYDKINQLRHVRYLKNKEHIKEILDKHRAILKPKFDLVESYFANNLYGLARWTTPKGGYFITLIVPNKAKEVITLCASAGLKLTDSGATHPYHNDTTNSYIRIAPSYPTLEELKLALEILVLAVKIVSME